MNDYNGLIIRLLQHAAWIHFTAPNSEKVKLLEEAAYVIKELSDGKEG